MAGPSDRKRFIFPRWANYVVPIALVAIVAGMPYNLLLIGLGLNPTTLNVGYQPRQPVAYSHETHVNQLGLDCRYCHTTVEKAAFAAIPPTQTCMNCHFAVKKSGKPGSDDEIAKIIAAYEGGEPLKWKKVHDLPDYAFFNHAVHINTGVSCVECHGRVDKMDNERNRVSIVKPLSMGWCIECHRAPESHIRPRDRVFDLNWGRNLSNEEVGQLRALGVEGLNEGDELTDDDRLRIGSALAHRKLAPGEINFLRDVRQRTDCSLCHR